MSIYPATYVAIPPAKLRSCVGSSLVLYTSLDCQFVKVSFTTKRETFRRKDIIYYDS